MRFSAFDDRKPTEIQTINMHKERPIDECAGNDGRIASASNCDVSTPTSKYKVVSTATYGSFEGPI